MFIVLTKLNGNKIRINTRELGAYEPNNDEESTSFVIANGQAFTVKESVDKIDKALVEGYIYIKETR